MDLKEVEAVVASFAGEDVSEISRINNKGLVNEVYVATTRSRKLVVRVDMGESDTGRFRKEKWCMDQAKQLSIPGPEVLAIDMMGGHPYIISSFCDGVPGDEAKTPKRDLWKTIGKYAKKIHSTKVSGFGERMAEDGVFDDDWERYVKSNLEDVKTNQELIKLLDLNEKEILGLRSIFEELLSNSFNFGLIHNDLSLNNTIVGGDGTAYLLDWGSAEAHVVPHMDIMEILDSEEKPSTEEFDAFLEGYGMAKSEFESIKSDLTSLRLLTFTDKLRWAMGQKPEVVDKYAERLKREISLTKAS